MSWRDIAIFVAGMLVGGCMGFVGFALLSQADDDDRDDGDAGAPWP